MPGNKAVRRAPAIGFILILGAFLLFIPTARAQFTYDENCREAYNAILALQFDEAHRLIAAEKKVAPSNPVPVYLENYIDFLTLFIGEDIQVYERLKKNKAARISILENSQHDSPFYNFCLAEVYLQWAFARIKFGDYTAAALEMRKAHALLTENKKRYPAFLINNIGLGVVHAIIGVIPDKYRWVTSLMGMDGSIDEGIDEISRVADYAGTDRLVLLYKPEALFYLAFFSANLQKDKKDAMNLLRRMNSQVTDSRIMKSPLLIFARATILMKNGHNDEALHELQNRNSMAKEYPFYYLNYLEGMTRLNHLDYSASACFDRFLDNFKGQNYIRAAYQKQALIAFLQGDTAKYYQKMSMARDKGVSTVDEDKQAYNESVRGFLPNKVLLRARFLFDGGYYNRALNELLDNSVTTSLRSKSDLVEYNYRLARIYHENGDHSRALQYYMQTIKLGKTEPSYFAASAAYHMGLLYENTGEYIKADTAYRVCLSINSPEYKTSLGQKAKAGLIRIKKNIPKT